MQIAQDVAALVAQVKDGSICLVGQACRTDIVGGLRCLDLHMCTAEEAPEDTHCKRSFHSHEYFEGRVVLQHLRQRHSALIADAVAFQAVKTVWCQAEG